MLENIDSSCIPNRWNSTHASNTPRWNASWDELFSWNHMEWVAHLLEACRHRLKGHWCWRTLTFQCISYSILILDGWWSRWWFSNSNIALLSHGSSSMCRSQNPLIKHSKKISSEKTFIKFHLSGLFLLGSYESKIWDHILEPSHKDEMFTGNPRVTPEVTRDVCLLARLMAANLYFAQIEDLMFEVKITIYLFIFNFFCMISFLSFSFMTPDTAM